MAHPRQNRADQRYSDDERGKPNAPAPFRFPVETHELRILGQAVPAEVLDATPEALLEAIRKRGWIPEQIEKVTSAYALKGKPPRLEGIEPWIDAKIVRDYKAKAKARAAKASTAMETAFRQAKNRAA